MAESRLGRYGPTSIPHDFCFGPDVFLLRLTRSLPNITSFVVAFATLQSGAHEVPAPSSPRSGDFSFAARGWRRGQAAPRSGEDPRRAWCGTSGVRSPRRTGGARPWVQAFGGLAHSVNRAHLPLHAHSGDENARSGRRTQAAVSASDTIVSARTEYPCVSSNGPTTFGSSYPSQQRMLRSARSGIGDTGIRGGNRGSTRPVDVEPRVTIELHLLGEPSLPGNVVPHGLRDALVPVKARRS